MSASEASDVVEAVSGGHMLRSRDRLTQAGLAIHESISACDLACMAAIASGQAHVFREALRITGNTVCGRHPIGVIMAALQAAGVVDESFGTQSGPPKGKFNFIRYERSSDVFVVNDSSVSYVSAFAIL